MKCELLVVSEPAKLSLLAVSAAPNAVGPPAHVPFIKDPKFAKGILKQLCHFEPGQSLLKQNRSVSLDSSEYRPRRDRLPSRFFVTPAGVCIRNEDPISQ